MLLSGPAVDWAIRRLNCIHFVLDIRVRIIAPNPYDPTLAAVAPFSARLATGYTRVSLCAIASVGIDLESLGDSYIVGGKVKLAGSATVGVIIFWCNVLDTGFASRGNYGVARDHIEVIGMQVELSGFELVGSQHGR
jgi:hypothetical protein